MDHTTEDLRNEAISLGLDGEDIFKYVLRIQDQAREDRALEREERNRERERQEREKERQEKEKERLENEKERQHQLELAKIKANSGQVLDQVDYVRKPSLPQYKEGEDIGLYLIRFERLAKL